MKARIKDIILETTQLLRTLNKERIGHERTQSFDPFARSCGFCKNSFQHCHCPFVDKKFVSLFSIIGSLLPDMIFMILDDNVKCNKSFRVCLQKRSWICIFD